MKLSINRLQLKAEIKWGSKSVFSNVKNSIYALIGGGVVSSIVLTSPYFDTLLDSLIFISIPIFFFGLTYAVQYFMQGEANLICDADELIVKNQDKTIQLSTHQIAQFYLKYNSNDTYQQDNAKVDFYLVTKEGEEINCFEDKSLFAEEGRQLEKSLEKFLGIEDFYVEGEYHIEGHQKQSLIQKSVSSVGHVGEISTIGISEGIIDKKFQFEWKNGTSDTLVWLNKGHHTEILYKTANSTSIEHKLNSSLFFEALGFEQFLGWDLIPEFYFYKGKKYQLVEDKAGHFISSYSEQKDITVKQKVFTAEDKINQIRISQFQELTYEIAISKIV